MRFYLDTSVFGGYFDKEFKDDTVKFFEEIQKQPITVVYSEITNEELIGAPDHVKDILYNIPSPQLEFVRVSE